MTLSSIYTLIFIFATPTRYNYTNHIEITSVLRDMSRILTISDTFDFRPSSRVYLDNGFLRVTGKAARTGVYQYLAKELDLKDRKPNDIVNVYRPAEEVFAADSINSYFNVDVTNDHPAQMVDAKSFRSTSVGHVVSASQDGDFVDVEMIIKDEKAIADVESGKTQLSPGYTAVYVEESGVAPCGTPYEFKQTSIDVNHVAIVSRGRGGIQVKINDHKGEKAMSKVTLDSGRAIEVEDNATALLITDSIERLTKSVTDAKNEVETQKVVIDTLNNEVTALKAATSDAAITERVKAVSATLDAARKKVGNDFTCDSVDVTEIQRAALTKVNKDADYSGKSADYIQGLFDAMPDKTDEEEETEDMGGRAKVRKVGDQYAALTKDGAVQSTERKSSYDAHKDRLANAWKVEK